MLGDLGRAEDIDAGSALETLCIMVSYTERDHG
jgi:hypothetical protein